MWKADLETCTHNRFLGLRKIHLIILEAKFFVATHQSLEIHENGALGKSEQSYTFLYTLQIL